MVNRRYALLNVCEHVNLQEIDVLSESDNKSIIGKAEYSQPICTALQIALVDLLATWGIAPSAVVGHSSGEIAAFYAADALTMKPSSLHFIVVTFART